MRSEVPSVSVIVPVYNGGPGFRLCLDGLAAARPAPLEVIVVGDGDSDGSSEAAEEFGCQVIRQRRSGPAAARNRGAVRARGEILFFVDADVVVSPDVIGRIVDDFTEDPSLSALVGSYDEDPASKTFLSQFKNLFHHYVHQHANEKGVTFWGACGAIRRDIFLAMGGFDESYARPCIEDVELGYRLSQAGHRIRFDKRLKVKHLKCWTLRSLLKSDIFDRALPWTRLILKYRFLPNDLNFRHSSRFSTLLAIYLPLILLGSLWWSPGRWVSAALALVLLFLNFSLYRFFWRKGGPWFALRGIPWHWFYYLYSGLAFAVGLAQHLVQASRAETPKTLPVLCNKETLGR